MAGSPAASGNTHEYAGVAMPSAVPALRGPAMSSKLGIRRRARQRLLTPAQHQPRQSAASLAGPLLANWPASVTHAARERRRWRWRMVQKRRIRRGALASVQRAAPYAHDHGRHCSVAMAVVTTAMPRGLKSCRNTAPKNKIETLLRAQEADRGGTIAPQLAPQWRRRAGWWCLQVLYLQRCSRFVQP